MAKQSGRKDVLQWLADNPNYLTGGVIIIAVLLSGFSSNIFYKIIIAAGLFALVWRFILSKIEEKVIKEEEIEESHVLHDELKLLMDATEIMASGGIGGKIPKLKSEDLMRVGENFQHLLTNIISIVQEIDEMSNKTSNKSRSLEDISATTSKVMHELSATLEELTSTTMHLNGSVMEIASGAKEVNQLSQEGMEQLSELEDKMQKIMTDSHQTSQSMEALRKSSKEMESIIAVITGIAKQTNLLALNAAIEAARAGESGRGFAVVADEVRKLASSTQTSLDDISRLISQFTKETAKTVKAIDKNNLEIEAGNGILNETTKKFEVIAQNIAVMVEEIEHSAQAAAQIAGGSEEIASAAAIQTTAISDISELSKDLSLMSSDLKNTLTNTRVGSMKLELDLDDFDKSYGKITEDEKSKYRKELDIENRYVIAMIARLEPNKGHQFFLKGLEEVVQKHPKAVCIIAGNGSLEYELQRQINNSSYKENVRFLGFRQDAHQLIAVSDLVVVTSEKEGMPPRILMEAMAAQKPIVSTDVDGAKALIKHTEQGLLVPYNDVARLVESICKIIEKPAVAMKFGQESRKRIEALHAMN